MNKILLPIAATLSLALAAPLAAQPPMGGMVGPAKGGAPSADERLARMTEQFDLTAEQQEAIGALLENQIRQREAMRTAFRARIDAVLTEEQRAKHDALMATRVERRVANLTEQLDLSYAQQSQLQTLFTESAGQGRMGRDGAMRDQLASILNPDQLAEFNQSAGGLGRRGDRARAGDCPRVQR